MISNANYKLIYSHYKSGNLNGIDIPVKENKNKIYQIGKSIKFDKIIDKIIQLIDRIFSALPECFHLEWPKRHLVRKTEEVLKNFSKKSIEKLPVPVKTQSAHILDSYSQSTSFALLPYDAFKAVVAGRSVAYNLLNDHFVDIYKTQLLPSLDWKSSQNFFDTQLPLVPLGNKNAARLYLELVKEGKFKLKLETLIAALRLCGDEVKSLDLRQLAEVISDDDIEIICGLCPNLSSFNLKNCDKISDQALKTISKLKHLRSLNISSTQLPIKNITDEGIQHLSKLTKLKELEISGCGYITQKAFKHIAIFKNLTLLGIRRIYYIPTPLAVRLVNKLSKLSDLRVELDDPLFFTKLKSPDRFRKLNIKKSDCLEQHNIFPLECFKNLVELNMGSCNVSAENLKNLSKLTQLKKLDLSNLNNYLNSTKIKNEHMKFLFKLTNLEELKLRQNYHLSFDTLKHLKSLKKLKKLDLTNSLYILKNNATLELSSNPGIIQLSLLTSLTELNIHGCSKNSNYTPFESFCLSNLVNLTKIKGGIPVSKSLSKLKKLKELDIVEVGVEDFKWLASLPHLHTLKLKSRVWDKVTDEQFGYLAKIGSLRDLKICNFWNSSKEKAEILNQLNLNNLEIGVNFDHVNPNDLKNLLLIKIHTTINVPEHRFISALEKLPPRFEIKRVLEP